MKDWYEYYRETCPVCNKMGGCMINSEGNTVVCVRIESKILFSKTMPMWVHHLGDNKRNAPKNENHIDYIEGNTKASDAQLHEVFNTMLGFLNVSEDHLSLLTSAQRQLTRKEINTRQYVTFPETPWLTVKSMLKVLSAESLVGVPGFFENDFGWSFLGSGGILIPYRNTRNQVVGFQTRIDVVPNVVQLTPNSRNSELSYELQARVIQQPNRVQVLCNGEVIKEIAMELGQEEEVFYELSKDDVYDIIFDKNILTSEELESSTLNIGTIKLVKGNRYFWVSSSNRKNGTGAGDPLPYHVAVPTSSLKKWPSGKLHKAKAVWITEGALKGDIAVEHIEKVYNPEELETIGSTFLCAPGVNTWRTLLPVLEEMGVERVNIAIDMDMMSNPYVYQAVQSLAKELYSKGYQVYVALWNEEDGNGIDDLLINQRIPQLRPLFK